MWGSGETENKVETMEGNPSWAAGVWGKEGPPKGRGAETETCRTSGSDMSHRRAFQADGAACTKAQSWEWLWQALALPVDKFAWRLE